MEATPGASETTTQQTSPARPRTMSRKQIAAVAVAVGALVLVVGAQTESELMRAVGATGHALEWISDLVASVAVTSLTYLWLHLRVTRAELMSSERARIAQDLHDELGSSLTRLSLMSDLLKEHKASPDQVEMRAARMRISYQR